MKKLTKKEYKQVERYLSVFQEYQNDKLTKEFADKYGYVFLGTLIEGQLNLCISVLKSFVFGGTSDFSEKDAWDIIGSLELVKKLNLSSELELIEILRLENIVGRIGEGADFTP